MSVEFVNLLINHELLMASLYKACADQFPELRDFWISLADEEEDHARTISDLFNELDHETLLCNTSEFTIEEIEESLGHNHVMVTKVNEGNVTVEQAIQMASELESSVIESKYYEVFEGILPNIDKKLKAVRDESKKHREKVMEMLIIITDK